MKRIYQCKDNLNSILTAVYDAWDSGLGHNNVQLEIENTGNLELFSEYIQVSEDEEKVEKVIHSIKRKLSEEVFAYVYKSAMSYELDKADAIYRFLVVAFKKGSSVIGHLGDPAVCRVFELTRNVSNETHLLLGFIRFNELESKILLGKIQPKNNVLSIIAPHFADRLSGENWIIFDENRKIAAIHKRLEGWVLVNGIADKIESLSDLSEDELGYQKLWSTFFNTIAIKERSNEKLQKQMLPLRYRKNMVEFNKLDSLAKLETEY
ncbi:MAG: DNA metabolism protein [Clostridiales bacterium]|nr:DNA metabolism protein [Clostridiales bacterium]